MASLLLAPTLLFLYFTAISAPFSTSAEFFEQHMSTKRMEKMAHLHFYFHDRMSGKNPTAIRIAGSKPNAFGSTFVIDAPLTEGPKPTTKLVGRAQGMYALASQHELGFLMVMNFVILEGIYNGSSLSVQGRNLVVQDVREMPVVGGTGVFRYALLGMRCEWSCGGRLEGVRIELKRAPSNTTS